MPPSIQDHRVFIAPVSRWSRRMERVVTYYDRGPAFNVMRLNRGAPLVPALIYQLCPMAVPHPTVLNEPDPMRRDAGQSGAILVTCIL
jgi:hypothetical protein